MGVPYETYVNEDGELCYRDRPPTGQEILNRVMLEPKDMVNHPPHYTTGKIEVIDFILDQKMGYLDGQVLKYICRYKHKGNPLEDLKKAQWYLNRLIEETSDVCKTRRIYQ